MIWSVLVCDVLSSPFLHVPSTIIIHNIPLPEFTNHMIFITRLWRKGRYCPHCSRCHTAQRLDLEANLVHCSACDKYLHLGIDTKFSYDSVSLTFWAPSTCIYTLTCVSNFMWTKIMINLTRVHQKLTSVDEINKHIISYMNPHLLHSFIFIKFLLYSQKFYFKYLICKNITGHGI